MKKLDKKKIIYFTKIKDPFLMIDKIVNIINLKSSRGVKYIKKDSWFFKCHFLNNPVMPGTLIEESILQTIVTTLYLDKTFDKRICLITSAKTNFFSKVTKSTTLYIDIKILKINKLRVEASGMVIDQDNKKIASGHYNYFISKK